MSAAQIHLQRRRVCDFCGKGEELAKVLIVAPGGVADICDECVSVCVEVLEANAKKKAASPESEENAA